MRRTTKGLAAIQAKLAAVENARNEGRDHFKLAPELLMMEVSRHASNRFDKQEQVIAFMTGYAEARVRHDEYKRGE